MRRFFEWIRYLLQLDGMSGMLHLETWSETNTDIYFRNGELVEIPNDVQTSTDTRRQYTAVKNMI